MKNTIFIIATLLLACGDQYIPIENTIYDLIPRKCNYVWFDNVKIETVGGSIDKVTYPINNPAIAVNQVAFRLSTCNVTLTDLSPSDQAKYPGFFDAPRWIMFYEILSPLDTKEGYRDQKDPVIENILNNYFNPTRTALIFLDYRLNYITDMKITCDKALFGVEAGQSLNSYFFIHSLHHDFAITSSKMLVAPYSRTVGNSLATFVSLKPYAPADMVLRPNSGLNVSSPVECKFTIEMVIEGNKTITAQTKTVTIIPKT